MSLKQLREYVLAHRHDKEAWIEFRSRPRLNAVTVSADTPPEEMKRILQEAINHQGNKEA